MAKDLEVALRITAKDSTQAAFSKTRAGLESISRQLEVARNAFLSFQAVMGLKTGLSGLAAMADEVQAVSARLRLASSSAREFAQAQQLAYRVAAQTGAGYQSIATLYARLAQSGRSFGLSQQQIANSVQSTALALKVSGASAAEASSVIVQFSQALGSGVLRGDEFNSIMENGGRLAKALADGLGLPIGRLRELAEQGLLTTDVVVRAIESQREALQREAAQMPRTIGEALQEVRDQFGRVVDEANRATGATSVISSALAALARNLETVLGAAMVAAAGAAAAALTRGSLAIKAYVLDLRAKMAADRQAALAAQAVAANEVAKAQAMLASAQAAVAAASGMARLSIVQTQLVPAQQRLAAAQAALNAAMATGTGVARGLAAALAFVGGPLGLILTLLSAGATAWVIWGDRAKSAADKAKDAIDRARNAAERLRREQQFGTGDAADLREGIAALEQRERLLNESVTRAGSKAAAEELRKVRQELAQRRQDLADLEARERQMMAPGVTELGRELMGKRFEQYLDQYRKKIDPLAAALKELREEAQRAGIALDSQEFREAEALVRRSFERTGSRLAKGASAALPLERFDTELALLKSSLKTAEDLLDAAFRARLVKEDEYWRAKGQMQERALDLEARELQNRLDEQQRLLQAPGIDEARARQARNQIEEIEAQRAALDGRRAVIRFEVQTNLDRARQELEDLKASLRERIADATGEMTPQMRRAAIERAYRETLTRMADDAEGAALARRLIDVEAAQANFAALEAAWRQVTERLRNAQEAIQIQTQAGLLTEAQARQQIVALQQQSAAEMERLLPLMQQAAEAIGPEAVIRVAAWRNELERTRLVTDELAPLWNRIGEGFGQAVQGMVSGAQGLREGLSNIFRSISEAFLQHLVIQPFQQWVAMQARMLAMKLGFTQQEAAIEQAAAAQSVATKQAETAAKVSANAAEAGSGAAASQAAIPVVGPGLALAAMAAMVAAVMALMGKVKKFAVGGYVSGPGTSTSDSIPARLSAGEYVVRAAAVKRVGVAFLDALNGLKAPPAWDGQRLALAAGGLVPQVQVPPAQPQVNQAVRIVNAIDPGVTHDHLQTPAGERVILNIIGRNARAVRAALA